MKFLILLALSLLSFTSMAETIVRTPINCFGEARIQGAIFVNRVDIDLRLNSVQDRKLRGHIARIDYKKYLHAPDLASCKQMNPDLIVCKGSGVGNGPELVVNIDTRRREASGTYFNVKARNISTPNDANTYVFDYLRCVL